MSEIVLHVWDDDERWEIYSSDEAVALATRATRDLALEWCEEHAEELGAGVVFLWEVAELRRLVR